MALNDFGDVTQFRLIERPSPQLGRPDEMLVRVRASSVNPIEWKMRQGLGLPHWLWRKMLGEPIILGLDFSGSVVATGSKVVGFKPGDEVCGATPLRGTYAEHVIVRPAYSRTAVALKPGNISHEQAALIPFAGLVAYACLVSEGGLLPSSERARVLIIGASGGVGHLAVQMAKRGLGAHLVVGVCSSRNMPLVRECGADEVVAYDQTSIFDIADQRPEWAGTFDLIVDAVGNDRYWTELAPKLLRPDGRFVAAALPQSATGGAGEDVDFMRGISLASSLLRRRLGRRYRLVAGLLGGLPHHTGFPVIMDWMASGKIAATAAASFDLAEIADAHRLSEGGRVAGKIGLKI